MHEIIKDMAIADPDLFVEGLSMGTDSDNDITLMNQAFIAYNLKLKARVVYGTLTEAEERRLTRQAIDAFESYKSAVNKVAKIKKNLRSKANNTVKIKRLVSLFGQE